MAYDAIVADKNITGVGVGSHSPEKSAAAILLAYLAAAPLIAAALVIVADGAVPILTYFMGLYGAALIIFFGGVRWGVAVMKPNGPTMRSLLGAILPLVLALPLFLPGDADWKFPLIMAFVALLLLDDLRATRRGSGAPVWYLGVRIPLTVLIEVALLVALVGMRAVE